ncbi:MAG TPA: ribose-phosphate pyrophosphokinase [Xanthobacteraceae bacterium]|nr:ribose-phosphate pyrophosphokinase [Xanthobacteraceae bacterium]
MNAQIFAMPGNEGIATSLGRDLAAAVGRLETHAFPDGETYLRFDADRLPLDVAIVCSLDRPNEKLLPLLFAADAARDLGAAKIGLVAPYLAYMRQDKRFKSGEAVTSRSFARLLSGAFDWLVTVEPHLHRYGSLAEIFSIPARSVAAAPALSQWIKANIPSPFLIGPDSESRPWISAVAANVGAPYTVLEKERLGDRAVKISSGILDNLGLRTPVLVDDIISSGQTMIEAVRFLARQMNVAPVCIAVHGIFAGDSEGALRRAGARLVTSNSIAHPTNVIDISGLMTPAIREFMAPCG